MSKQTRGVLGETRRVNPLSVKSTRQEGARGQREAVDNMANKVVISAFLTLSVLVVCIGVSAGKGTVAFEATCTKEEDCKTVDAVCEQGDSKANAEKICKCNSSSVHIEDGDKCLAKVTIDLPCEVPAQCKASYPDEDVTCREDNDGNKVCLCIKGKHFFSKKCYKSVENGERCTKEEECFWVQDMECTEEKCACKEGYTYDNKKKECSGSAAIQVTSVLTLVLFILLTRLGM